MANVGQNPTLKKAMLAALEATYGIVSQAAPIAGIHRNTHYEWLATDPEYAKAVKDLDDIAIDFAESALRQQMAEGSTPATIFFLKTKGRKRGYDERATLELSADTVKTLLTFEAVKPK